MPYNCNVISGISTTPNTVCKKEYFNAEDRSKYAIQIVNNFNPFVMLPKTTNLRFGSFSSAAMAVEIKERSWSVSSYSPDSYLGGFNGQEKENDISGVEGVHVVFSYRIHDARLGRFLSVDPLFKNFAYNSTYAFAENKVILCIDLEGLEALPAFGWKTCGFTPGRVNIIMNKSKDIQDKVEKIGKPIMKHSTTIASGAASVLSGGTVPVIAGSIAVVGGTLKLIFDLTEDFNKSVKTPTTISGTVLTTVNFMVGEELFSTEVVAMVEIIEGVATFRADISKLKNGTDAEKIEGALKIINVTVDLANASESIKTVLTNSNESYNEIQKNDDSDFANQRDNSNVQRPISKGEFIQQKSSNSKNSKSRKKSVEGEKSLKKK